MSIKIENIVGPSPAQWESVILGCRNPFNSWSKSDSSIFKDPYTNEWEMKIGEADLALMRKLAKAGSDHRKYLRQLPVIMDVTAPLYLWKEEDQYKVGTVTNSCSTMHKIQAKEFTFDDFSYEHLSDFARDYILGETIHELNVNRTEFINTGDKFYWWQMIQLLPSSFNQKRTLSCNYEVLWNMYQARKNHRLDEWHVFCDTIVREVPYFAEIFEI